MFGFLNSYNQLLLSDLGGTLRKGGHAQEKVCKPKDGMLGKRYFIISCLYRLTPFELIICFVKCF